jgi:Domain of unknown function (DUF1996)
MRFRVQSALVIGVPLLALTACASSANTPAARHVTSTPRAQLLAAVPGGGVFHTTCAYSHAAPDDPIVHPNMPGASHLHNFFGNTTTNAASTLASLNAGASNCRVLGGVDRSGYWVPALYFNGTYVPFAEAQAYYESVVGPAITPPPGLEVIGGSAMATAPLSTNQVKWTCDGNAGVAGATSPPVCPAGTHLKVVVKTPNCLDATLAVNPGGRNDTPNSTYAYLHGGRCPAGYSPLPTVRIEVKYPSGIDGRGVITLASGAYYTMHADWFNAWDPTTLNLFVTRCINAGIDCGSTVPQGSPAPAPTTGYWMAGATGQVYAFGNAHYYGGARTGAVVHIEPTPHRHGYWIVNAVGQVFGFGDAVWHGNAPALVSGESVRSLSSTATGSGYWLFTSRGRVFSFGDAHFYGDMSGKPLNGPIVASVATATGHGYYMVGSDGGIFTFGDAQYHGSMGGQHLNRPVISLVPTSNAAGYWLVASDGGIFAFDAPYRGSTGGMHLNRPIVGMVRYGNGYLMVASDGGVFDFSNLAFVGSLAGKSLPAPIVGIAATG